MPRLLIQCQGSPGPLAFKVSKFVLASILEQYYHIPGQSVILITSDLASSEGSYYINLALVSWMCVIDENEPEIKPEPKPRPNNEYPPEI